MKRVLIIGMGSIGQKHYQTFQSLGADVRYVSRHRQEADISFSQVHNALSQFDPDICLIANDTSQHLDTLKELLSHPKPLRILVEKPLFHHPAQLSVQAQKVVYVGYNLRFLPLLQRLKEEVANRTVLSADIYCGSYLPNWRAGMDYRKTASASSHRGGGVLRDLSHDLDYTQWLLGEITPHSMLSGTFSNLDLDVEDTALILARAPNCPALTIRLNYTDHLSQRYLHIICDDTTLHADLLANTLTIGDTKENFEGSIQDTYLKQAKAILSPTPSPHLSTFEEALKLLHLIAQLEKMPHV
ncbi:Gfo/Idh/MocA family protein [Terasakiella pusilla]|uniref:Gfo/Idh/MocA family protein n=1 Tax=Terasakiella pusilla TaxID=64973 RepID=UPI003AA832C0